MKGVFKFLLVAVIAMAVLIGVAAVLGDTLSDRKANHKNAYLKTVPGKAAGGR